MRSHGSVVTLLLLPHHVLRVTRRPLHFALKTLWAHLLGPLAAHHWLEPGLIFAAVLLLLPLFSSRRSSIDSLDDRAVHRVFRAPDLSRFRGIAPRDHRDLEA